MRNLNGSVYQTMSLEPLKTALSATDVGETSLALPSDRGARSAQQRVLEQVSTIKRTKSKYRSKSASFSPTSPTFDTIDNKLFSPSNGLEGSLNGFIKSKKSIKSIHSWGSTGQRNQNFSPIFPSLPRSNGTIHHKPPIERKCTVPPLRNGSYYPSNGIQSPTKNANLVPKFGAKGGSEINGKNEEKRASEITLKEAVDCLVSTDESHQICGASFIQHCTFTNENSKKEVLKLGGIPSLVALMGSPSLKVQETSAAALRNLVFKDLDSKETVEQCGGVAQAVQLLGKTDSAETQKHVTGLLWNLSSADKVKPALLRSALPVLTKSVLQPFSAKMNQNDKPLLDTEIFYNATGCLRNLSCGKPISRKAMRKCEGLVDSVFAYVQNCVSMGDTNNKSLENCVCTLHNLTYQLETESPEVFSKINALATSRDNENSITDSTSPISCFSSQSRKIQESHFDFPVMEDNNPKGQNWLIHSQALESFLSLMGTSESVAVREACCGALQNLTAPKGLVGEVMSQNLVQKLNGLRHISPLLDNSSIKNKAIGLLGNLSRNPRMQSIMAREALPQLSRAVTSSMGADPSPDNDLTMATACNTLSSLMRAKPELAASCLNADLINSLNNLSRNKGFPSSSKAAGVLLHSLWSDKTVQSFLRKSGMNKKSFVNEVTSAAIRSVQVIE